MVDFILLMIGVFGIDFWEIFKVDGCKVLVLKVF